MNYIGHDTSRRYSGGGGSQPVGLLPEALLRDVAENASRRDATRDLPFDAIGELKSLRFGASRLSVQAGGGGATLKDCFTAAYKLAAADSNVAHIWRNHFMLIERLIVHPTNKPFLLNLRERVAQGDLIGLAGTELDRKQTGGPSPLSTRLVRNGDGYRLSGKKFYSTGSLFSDWVATYAELETGEKVGLVLPRLRQGIELIDDWDGMGQRLTGTGTTIFNDVEVAPEELIGADELHPQGNFFSSVIAQLFLTTVIAGITSSIAEEATTLLGSRERTFYFAPSETAKDDPILLASLGERQADAFATRAIVLSAAEVLDEAAAAIASGASAEAEVQAASAAAAKAKIAVDAIAIKSASALFDIAGASATVRSKNLDRHWRNIRTIASHNPASYKAFAVGNQTLNGTPLPTLGFF
jgi:alkylation response protein AidB-like acyl-CoA dehydrogenase